MPVPPLLHHCWVPQISRMKRLSNFLIAFSYHGYHDDVITWKHFRVTGEFPTQRPVTRGFDVFFDLHQNQQLSKQWRRRWLESPSRSLWRHRNDRINFATENMQHFSLTRHAFMALLIQLALFRVDCAVDISISRRQNIYFSKDKRSKMPIIRYGGYLLKHHIVNTMSESWAITCNVRGVAS